MYKSLEMEEIKRLLEDRPHLDPVFTHTLNVPERVREYDSELFLVFNHSNKRFEIHSKEAGETTYNATVPYKNLDARTIRYIMKNDIRVHGMKIYDRINKSEENHKKSKERAEKKHLHDFAKEFRSEFAKDAWTM